MARSYRGIRPHSNRVYTIDATMKLYDVSRSTVSRWVVEGMRPIDQYHPQLFLGAELDWFHRLRAAASRVFLRPSQFKCLGCKGHVSPNVSTLQIEERSEGPAWVRAECPACGGIVRKLLDRTTCDAFRICQELNTSLESLDEAEGAIPAGIGKEATHERPRWTPENERILYALQIYATRYTGKTLDAKLAAVRHFEEFCGKRQFSAIRPEDAALYTAHLIECGRSNLAKSTIQHRAAHLKGFFEWLGKQNGYRRLNKSIPDYFALPKAETAKALQPPPRAYPTTEQFHRILSSMPSESLMEQRDRAVLRS